MEPEWVDPLVERLRNVNVKRLSGGATTAAELAAAKGQSHRCTSALRFLSSREPSTSHESCTTFSLVGMPTKPKAGSRIFSDVFTRLCTPISSSAVLGCAVHC